MLVIGGIFDFFSKIFSILKWGIIIFVVGIVILIILKIIGKIRVSRLKTKADAAEQQVRILQAENTQGDTTSTGLRHMNKF